MSAIRTHPWRSLSITLLSLVLVWILLARLRILPASLNTQYEARFEWSSDLGFRGFYFDGEKSQNRFWRAIVAAQVRPELDRILRKSSWKRADGQVVITVSKAIPVANLTAPGSGGLVLVDPDTTSLMKEAARGDIRSAASAVLNGADVNAVDQQGDTALGYACMRAKCSAELVQVLVQAGADVNARNKTGQTPLLLSIYSTPLGLRLGSVNALLHANANPNISDNNGETPLMAAAKVGDTEVARELLNFGANLAARDHHGATAVMLGESAGQTAVVEMLREYGRPR